MHSKKIINILIWTLFFLSIVMAVDFVYQLYLMRKGDNLIEVKDDIEIVRNFTLDTSMDRDLFLHNSLCSSLNENESLSFPISIHKGDFAKLTDNFINNSNFNLNEIALIDSKIYFDTDYELFLLRQIDDLQGDKFNLKLKLDSKCEIVIN